MKGVILAAGYGTRLYPVTKVMNKHLLPVFDRPMIYWSLQALKDSGITDIMIVTSREHSGHFGSLLGSGEEFGINLSYGIQETASGIADALWVARNFAGADNIAVILGDNIFGNHGELREGIEMYQKDPKGAMVFVKEVNDPHRFGVATIQGGSVIEIEEKPERPKSNLIVTGLYLFDSQVFGIIETIKPSLRGELEITDVNNRFINRGQMRYHLLKSDWADAGTFTSLLRASLVAAGIDPSIADGLVKKGK